jgi:exoribonuclease II
MKTNSIQSFAIGLLVATVVFAAVYFFGPSETTTSQTVKAPSEDEMKIALTDKGYVIQTEEEWTQQQVALEEAKKNSEKAPKEEAPAETGKVEYHAMLSVSSGMTSIHVGQALEQMKIIKKASDFSNQVEARGLSNKLKPGVFEVKSGMTIDELISVIFGS